MKVKIIKFNGYMGPQWSNLTEGSLHDIAPTPSGETGLWIMGVDEPVKLLDYEFIIVAD